MSDINPPDASEVIRLWPDGPPTVIADVPDEVEFPAPKGPFDVGTFFRNISDATLTVFTPTVAANGVGIIVVPGGGWTINAWTHEGKDVARWLAGEGYTCFVLKYRLQASPADPAAFDAMQEGTAGLHATPWPKANKPGVIGDLMSAVADFFDVDKYLEARAACADDGRRAIEVVRAEAERFGLRPGALGMIGFSAGAFLIADVALEPRAEQVAFIAPIYGGETDGKPVPADAPPLFTAVAQDDVLVKVVEGLHEAWTAADRPAEIHGFARGSHGFGMCRQGAPSDRWTDLFLAWLDDLQL